MESLVRFYKTVPNLHKPNVNTMEAQCGHGLKKEKYIHNAFILLVRYHPRIGRLLEFPRVLFM